MFEDAPGGQRTAHDSDCKLRKFDVVVSGVLPKRCVRRRHVQVTAIGEDALGLLEDHAAVECVLELHVDRFLVCGGAVLDENDRGDVGEGLREAQVSFVQRSAVAPNRLSAPRTLLRKRIGTAWTLATPAVAANAANPGHRWAAAARSGTCTGRLSR